jgi:DNA-directed RNA polymerase II subunit RPB1
MSVIDRFPHSTAELRRVKAVQFGVLSPDEIVRVVPRCEIRSSPAKKQDSRVA